MTLTNAAYHVLNTPEADEKVRLTFVYAEQWQKGEISEVGTTAPPDHPARPQKPELLNPRDMPRRRLGTQAGRTALIHAICHIELNAIDLAWDMVARFTYEDLPKAFFEDWVQVAYDEAVHFQLLNDRLKDFNATYGDYPAHNGLWDAAQKTQDDIMARCALVPMLLEPRGLDTTPPTVERLRRLGDEKTANIMARIGTEEIPHVAAGTRWFNYMTEKRGLNPQKTFQTFVRKRFKGVLKAPFNVKARNEAGLTEDYYLPVSDLAENV